MRTLMVKLRLCHSLMDYGQKGTMTNEI